MNEYRRMQYLDAMGIEMFVPRKRLVSAKASTQLKVAVTSLTVEPPTTPATFLTSALAVPSPAAASIEPVQPNSVNSAPAGPKLVSPLVAQFLDQNTPPTRPVSPSNVTGTPTKTLRFCLKIWSQEPWLLIDSHQPQGALPTETLLHNILFSLGIGIPSKADTIQWPVVENSSAPAGLEAAREMMSAFIDTKLAQQAGKIVVLFGHAAFESCTLGGDFNGAIFTQVPLAQATALVLPSLSDILKSPHLKAQVWQALTRLMPPRISRVVA